MCGIAGFLDQTPRESRSGVLRRMTDAIAYRGPDDCGAYEDAWVSLGHRRLSIIDLSRGHQPASNESGDLWIVYNGEIFNHADLRPELEAAGHVYRSHCDTETILHAYEEYGADCLRRFRGMFSFAIWDSTRRRLFCARDRLGIKPFYYFWDRGAFVFASEIKALLEHPAVSPALRESALPEYLAFGYCSSELTMFQGICKLMPGHTLILDLASDSPAPAISQYWDLRDTEADEGPSDREWIAETRRRLEETVRMRLMSDVPLGMFLSGGVDSSAIAALIKRQNRGPVKTFAVGYRESCYSELPYASEVARSIGTEHREVVIGMQDFFEALPGLIWHEDEPIAWPSSVSLAFVSELASREVRVVLTGEGSDELFAGYGRYGWTRLNMRLLKIWQAVSPNILRNGVRAQIAHSGLLSRDLRRKLSHSFLACEDSIESLYIDAFYSPFSKSARRELLNGVNDDGCEPFRRYWNERPAASTLSRMLYADQKTYIVELLMKQDQMSMAASIESRVPFLDHTFVEFAMRMPDRMKIRGGIQKYVLKEAVSDLLPRGIIHRPKMGFPTPLRQWLRQPEAEPLIDSLLASDRLVASCFNMDVVRRLVADHRAGSHDCTDRLWNLLNLQIWGDIFLTGHRPRVNRFMAREAGIHVR
jgi:asparagine synthase (glutamine-hydrolysing)